MQRALVFSGQGSHRAGMSMNLLTSPSTSALWERMKDCMMQNYGIPLQDVIKDNPVKIYAHADAMEYKTVFERCCKNVDNISESTERPLCISNSAGVMSYTFLTQPCVLAAQMLTIEKLKENKVCDIHDFSMIAGHSLGEFTALCALGVFSPETALNLTYKRGLLMHQALEHASGRLAMYACNPVRAKLHENAETADDIFFVLIELVARALSHTSSFIEVANFNLPREQYVVGGDKVALAVLGKCLDPQFRANCLHGNTIEGVVQDALASAKIDQKDGINANPNAASNADFVSSSARRYGNRATFRRFVKGPDDGFTPALDQLTHLTLEEEGRSGLKKKSWFIPLSVEIPFHTSSLRRCTDEFLPIVRGALPSEEVLRELLSVSSTGKYPLWVNNFTGRIFKPLDKDFQNEAREGMSSLNIGEVRHHGKYSSNLVLDTFEEGIKNDSVSEILTSILASQLSHPVMWIDVMEEMVVKGNCRDIVEIAPVRNVSEMFKRSIFKQEESGETIKITTASYPSDGI